MECLYLSECDVKVVGFCCVSCSRYFPYSRDFAVSPVSLHFLYARDFVFSPVFRCFPFSRDFAASPVSGHFPYSRDFVVSLFLDTLTFQKCLETGKTTKSFEKIIIVKEFCHFSCL